MAAERVEEYVLVHLLVLQFLRELNLIIRWAWA
jgi:hypothetical protein